MTTWGQPRRDDDPYWREQGKVWVEYLPGRKRLVDLNRPKPAPVAKSDFPCPAIHSDNLLTPLQSMADGQWYDSKSEMMKTYRADGNPQGVNYEVVGDTQIEPYSRPSRTKADDEATHAAISRALDEYGL